MAEIMTNKGMGAAVVTNQAFTLLIGLTSNKLIESLHGETFIMFGVISLIVSTSCYHLFYAFCAHIAIFKGVVFFIFCMKETKGLSQAQIKRLYRKDKRDLDYGL